MSTNDIIFIIPHFHYDVAYLKSYQEYLPQCVEIIDRALDLLDKEPSYRFLIEQTILLEQYWVARPGRREHMKSLAVEGRLAVAPGMYAMPDMNLPDGESMFLQIKYGKEWLKDKLGIDTKVCWIPDCWGHHAQLPQILTQAKYEYYAFFRAMRKDAAHNDFLWQGLDGSIIKTHWLADSYSSLIFPSDETSENAEELNLSEFDTNTIIQKVENLKRYGESGPYLLGNGGDFLKPQKSAPKIVHQFNSQEENPTVRFATPGEALDSIDWSQAPSVQGEFNSLFQGTFTTNIAIKQRNRKLVNTLLSLETLEVIGDLDFDKDLLENAWKNVLKQQFHDTICGTICDQALLDSLREMDEAENMIAQISDTVKAEKCETSWFNPLPYERTESLEIDGEFREVTFPAFGTISRADVKKTCETYPKASLPIEFKNDFYHAKIDSKGYVTSLKTQDSELVGDKASPFGELIFQIDNGDNWLNFNGPIGGPTDFVKFARNTPDPYSRAGEDVCYNQGTSHPRIDSARIVAQTADTLIIEQTGVLLFWRIHVPFVTRIHFRETSPRIDYHTRIEPSGKHYRIRASFPCAIRDGDILHEIPYGIQTRGEGEHVAQNWMAYTDEHKGLALLNRGIPANNVTDNIMFLTLFRSVAMEYKTQSELSFGEGVPLEFDYAVCPYQPRQPEKTVKEALKFNRPPLRIPFTVSQPSWLVQSDNVILSACRRSGNHVLLRFYECAGKPGTITIKGPMKKFAAANGLEQPESDFTPIEKERQIQFEKYEIKSVLLSSE